MLHTYLAEVKCFCGNKFSMDLNIYLCLELQVCGSIDVLCVSIYYLVCNKLIFVLDAMEYKGKGTLYSQYN